MVCNNFMSNLLLFFYCFYFLVLEISTHNYGIQNPKLIEKILNGKCELYRKIEKSTKDAGTTSHAGKYPFN